MNSINKRIKNLFKKGINHLGYRIQKIGPLPTKFTPAAKLLEFDYGHLISKKLQKAVDANNQPIPWFTYPAIDYLNQLDFSNKEMLEWGAGSSSIYFSKKVKKIYSIESNQEWYELLCDIKIENQELFLATDNYVEKPSTLNKKFDIILIDGILRDACANKALDIIKPKGLIILDNSDRHPDIAAIFRNKNYIQVDFHGFGPINDYTWTTSIFMDRQVDLQPISIQPMIPIGGGY